MGTLVGRDAELARLRALLADAAAGRPVHRARQRRRSISSPG